jgi:hypothetical protein
MLNQQQQKRGKFGRNYRRPKGIRSELATPANQATLHGPAGSESGAAQSGQRNLDQVSSGCS